MKILVTGSRGWLDYAFIRRMLSAYPADSTVIEGGARGADQMAARAAKELGMTVQEMKADWRRQGRRAGAIRNLAMLSERPNVVLAFWDGKSRGTEHMVNAARLGGFEVKLYVNLPVENRGGVRVVTGVVEDNVD